MTHAPRARMSCGEQPLRRGVVRLGSHAAFISALLQAAFISALLQAAFISALLAASSAHAQAGATLGESSRAAALAGSITARGGDLAVIHASPAALGELERSSVALFGHAGQLRLDGWRDGEPASLRQRRWIAGYGAALGVRLPGPEWLARARLGAAIHLPVEHVLRVRAPPRTDAPLPALDDARIERTAIAISVAYQLPWGISLGLGLSLAPTLIAATTVRFDASRGDHPDEGVIVELEREVRLEPAPIVGIHGRLAAELAIGLAYHGAVVGRATGPNDLRAGAILAEDPVDLTFFYEPEQVSAGIVVGPLRELSISADLSWQRWSEYRSVHGLRASPGLKDALRLRTGMEWTHAWFAVRAGYAFEPSPVPAQIGPTTLLDGDRHVLAIGLGFDLEALARLPIRIDLHARTHVIAPISARKDPALLEDSDPSLRGQQIDDLGYPGYSARIGIAQLGLTISVPLEGPR